MIPPRSLIAAVGLMGFPSFAAEAGADERIGRLAASDSTYLRSLSSRAVDWHEWGPAAWEEARRIGRPVLVSIGNFTCAWTARTDRTIFESPEMATLLNGEVVAVKVDRFERPDLDRLYQRYAEATHQRAGWPLHVWVTPDRLPLRIASVPIGGAEDDGTFASEMQHLLEQWVRDSGHLSRQAEAELQAVVTRAGVALAGPLEIDEALLLVGESQVLGQFDPQHGGFGRAPKFPSPARLEFLAQRTTGPAGNSNRRDEVLAVVRTTLDRLRDGALHDQLDGGFFRYALDEGWRRPCFEKMVLDQARHAEAYLLGHWMTGEDDYARVARSTLEFAQREFGHPEGGFYNAVHSESRDPDSGDWREGVYYAWTAQDLRHRAGTNADVVAAVFEVLPGGNLPPGTDPFSSLAGMNLLARPHPLAPTAARLGSPLAEVEDALFHGRQALLAARRERPPPDVDRLQVTQVNAALISAFCRAAGPLNEPEFLLRARRAAEFVERHLWDAHTNTLYRCRLDRPPTQLAVADDFAFLVRALLDLHETTGEIHWLHWATAVQTAFDHHHLDAERGGYTDAGHRRNDVPAALKPVDDAAVISANAVAGQNLQRWACVRNNPALSAEARRLLEAFAGPLRAGSGSVAGLFQVAQSSVRPPRRLILLGPINTPELVAARARLSAEHRGQWQVMSLGDGAARDWVLEHWGLPESVRLHPLDQPGFCVELDGASSDAVQQIADLHNFLAGERS
jgi:uncharacterized protein YyaL (SSP411 family)